jgi:hypothetical protein
MGEDPKAVVGQAGGDVGAVVLHADELHADKARAYLVDRYSGCKSWATTRGVISNRREKCSLPSVNDR